ncbi:MAG: anti-sigma factor antagonist [Deltaproteobacteria bacterium]|uniref:STAS domain-containing protein n=1 Tax=Hydrosulfovibrio ferrireducens TaxID=2934181 RepID=UPI0011FFAD8E|nr:MAG: anti-sigma factor antagonist [Deltaproteobacteria bacterium]
MTMTCETATQGETASLTLSGTIDEEGAATLKQQFNTLPHSQLKELVVDLAGVSRIGSSGIGKLLLFYKHMAAHGGTIRLTRVPQPIHDLFTELRLDTLFSMSTGR